MSPLRFTSALLFLALGAGFFGCSLFGSSENASSSSTGEGGAGGSGGAGGKGGASSSTGIGGSTPTDCTDHVDGVKETVCSLLKQDCGNGETCRPNDLGTGTLCLPGAGVKGIGAPCLDDNINECESGLICVFGFCSPICCPSRAAEFCGSASCNVNTFPDSKKRVWACNFAKVCTLYAGNDCPPNQDCRLQNPADGLSLCAPPVFPVSEEGGVCEFLNNCGAAQVCNFEGAARACRYSCLVADWQTKDPGMGGCPMGQTCIVQGPKYGVCQP